MPFLSFSMKFPLLYSYSLFSIATPSIFGNAHWILKTAPQTSSPTVRSIPLCFHYFSLFHCFFSLSIARLSIFENVHCTLKGLPNIITNSEHHTLFFPEKFPLFYCCFSFAKHPFLFGSGPLDPENSAQCCHQQ